MSLKFDPAVALHKVSTALTMDGLLTDTERVLLGSARTHIMVSLQPGNGHIYKREVKTATAILKRVLDCIEHRAR